MVNKSPCPPNENINAGGHQNLEVMQAQHRSLVEEIEILRRRAAELSELSETLHTSGSNEAEIPAIIREPNDTSPSIPTNPVEDNAIATETTSTAAVLLETDPVTAENVEEAAYLTERMAEIAALKAKYSRVQHIMEMNKRIDDFMASKDAVATSSNVVTPPATTTAATATAFDSLPATGTAPTMSEVSEQVPPTSVVADGTESGNSVERELLANMVSMLNDFTSDLRNEADSLRTERERINNLKLEIMRNRKNQS